MGTAKVSVIIPAWRCAGTVARAVASAHAQTLRPAELIVIDDASGDGTLGMLRALQARYGEEWLRIVALGSNGGASVARNSGWEVATQPLIAFLDSDDAWHPRKIELQHAFMASNPEAALSAHGSAQLAEGEEPGPLPARVNSSRLRGWQLLLSNRIATSTVMLRTQLPFRFSATKRRSEDYLLWLELAQSGAPLHLLRAQLAFRYKAPFGEGGLSAALGAMEAGELDTFRTLRASGALSAPAAGAAMALSVVKHLRRVAQTRLRARRSALPRAA